MQQLLSTIQPLRRQCAVRRATLRALPRESGRVRRRVALAYFDVRCATVRRTSRTRRSCSRSSSSRKHRKVAGAMVDASTMRKQVLVLRLISKFRRLGMFHADLDPLKRQEKPIHRRSRPRDLRLHAGRSRYGFRRRLVQGRHRPDARSRDLMRRCEATYCRTFGAEYMYISDTPTKRLIQQRLEPMRARPTYSADEQRHILERLTAAETLERYLHTRYVGQKRFSLEGGETMIPMLDHLIQRAGAHGVQETVIGMAHRGRLNVLVNMLGKMPADLFAEFEGKHGAGILPPATSSITRDSRPTSSRRAADAPVARVQSVAPGDRESGRRRLGARAPAPARGREGRPGAAGPDPRRRRFRRPGRGDGSPELAQTRGFDTGGTIHLVINNQIGFTTSDPRDSRATIYCTDIAKMVEAPIFTSTATTRKRACARSSSRSITGSSSTRTSLIDLVCFRRLGHNEAGRADGDAAADVQEDREAPGHAQALRRQARRGGRGQPEEPEAMVATYRNALDKGHHTNKTMLSNYKPPFTVDWSPFKGTQLDEADDIDCRSRR